MTVFCKCPICGASAVVKPELANNGNKVFRCENGHQFHITLENPEKSLSQDVWDHMPRWGQIIHDLTKNGKYGA